MEREKPYETGELPFSTEGRLLQELGERLVVSADLALTELVKNAYDADSSSCKVILEKGTIVVEDNGLGMTFDDFRSRWMTIATSSRQQQTKTNRFGRTVTGAKGIGRFAVRFLGEELELVSTAYDATQRKYTRLVAEFNWKEIDKLQSLAQSRVPYKLFLADNSAQIGTRLTIRKLKSKSIDPQEVRTNVIKIVSPLSGLERGKFKSLLADGRRDPGFSVTFEKELAGSESQEDQLAATVLSNYWCRLLVELEGDSLEYKVDFNYPERKVEKPFRLRYLTNISNGMIADIRFFPRRAGIFQNKEIDGQEAWRWVRENSGIAIIDHGFRIKPYGYPKNDWLYLDIDHSHNERNWRTGIMKTNFEMTPEQRQHPSLNPMINLPINYQLVGGVFVESKQRGQGVADLVPAMDREGFIETPAFNELREIVRGGIEFLALLDKRRELEIQESQARQATKNLRKDLRLAAESINDDENIPPAQKHKIVETYARLAKEIESVDEYNRKARENLEVISLLGVVAGFMTHEADRIRSELKKLTNDLKELASKDASVRPLLDRIGKSISELDGQLSYSSLFIQSIHSNISTTFKIRPQVEYLLERFGGFAERRNIKTLVEIDETLLSPKMHVNIYSGILLNLYTNAIKAILLKNAQSNGQNRILIKAWNLPQKHVLEVCDNGIGIPESLKERIWDPLFTTTSSLNSPLGTGMGLGLSLSKKISRDLGGVLKLVDPPKDYVTCFRLEFPR